MVKRLDVAASVEAYFDGSAECVGSESADGTRWAVGRDGFLLVGRWVPVPAVHLCTV